MCVPCASVYVVYSLHTLVLLFGGRIGHSSKQIPDSEGSSFHRHRVNIVTKLAVSQFTRSYHLEFNIVSYGVHVLHHTVSSQLDSIYMVCIVGVSINKGSQLFGYQTKRAEPLKPSPGPECRHGEVPDVREKRSKRREGWKRKKQIKGMVQFRYRIRYG